jgi:hypothetical protein
MNWWTTANTMACVAAWMVKLEPGGSESKIPGVKTKKRIAVVSKYV